MDAMEPEHIAAPVEPVYSFFDSHTGGIVEIPVVKAHRGPIVFRQATPWDHAVDKAQRSRRKVRYWLRTRWWPSRIRDLERQVAYLTQELDDWD